MADSLTDPDIHALVSVIESLQERIRRDGGIIGANEIRTRTALIDPLLNALGWNTADPAMVIPEYAAGGGAADYALLKALPEDGSPVIAFVEAKRLNEPLQSHRAQMLNYANMAGVKYAALTNGDRWELYEVFREAPLDERRILDISLRWESAIDCAVKSQLLMWPNLETGGALPSENAQVLLSQALQTGASPSVITLLIDRGAGLGPWNDQGWTPLHFAVHHNSNPEIIALLLDRGSDITAKDEIGWTPLHDAAYGNLNPKVVELLLSYGADVTATDSTGLTPLHYAILQNSNPQVIDILINWSVDTTAAAGRANWLNFNMCRSSPEIITLLLDRGASIAATTVDGRTPLHSAARHSSNPQVFALLLDRGADITATDNDGKTPLHFAAENNSNPEVIALLLNRGADIAACTFDGKTAYQIAEERGASEEVLRLLRV